MAAACERSHPAAASLSHASHTTLTRNKNREQAAHLLEPRALVLGWRTASRILCCLPALARCASLLLQGYAQLWGSLRSLPCRNTRGRHQGGWPGRRRGPRMPAKSARAPPNFCPRRSSAICCRAALVPAQVCSHARAMVPSCQHSCRPPAQLRPQHNCSPPSRLLPASQKQLGTAPAITTRQLPHQKTCPGEACAARAPRRAAGHALAAGPAGRRPQRGALPGCSACQRRGL